MVSALVGLGLGLFLAFKMDVNGALAAVLGVVVALVYPIAGAVVAVGLEGFRDWAYCGRLSPRSKSNTMGVAAGWPLCLLYALVVYPSMGIINRLFSN